MRQIGAWRPHRNAGACARSAPEPRQFWDRRPGSRLVIMLVGAAILSAGLSASVLATDLLYVLQSPSFGGNNPAAFQSAQFEKSLRDQRAASAAAAAKVTAAPDPNQQFANAIISQLNSLVARDVALKISNLQFQERRCRNHPVRQRVGNIRQCGWPAEYLDQHAERFNHPRPPDGGLMRCSCATSRSPYHCWRQLCWCWPAACRIRGHRPPQM
jgi:hypothetical protein